MAKIFIESLAQGYEEVLHKGFSFLKNSVVIKRTDNVYIKPNLTFPVFRKGVMTTPDILEALVKYLKNYTDKIAICESDGGGYNIFPMDEVFRITGIYNLAQRYNIRIINMSYEPSRQIYIDCGIRKLSVPLPEFLLTENNIFITVPVPKMHLNTIVSLSIKNQWGIIQKPSLRLKLHPYFKEVVYGINKSLHKLIAVVDGKYGLNRSGPLRGDAIELNWILISDNIFYTDYLVTELMGLNYQKIGYLKYIFKKEGINSLQDVVINTDYTKFKKERFYLKRKWTDYPGVLTFNSRLFAYIGYESFLAKPLHWLLYKFRRPFY